MTGINVIVLIFILCGAINWGLIGFANYNFFGWLLGGDMSVWARIVYAVIGIAGLWGFVFFGRCGSCKSSHPTE